MAELIAGPNFSGRSEALMARLREAAPAFFVGPYAEAALSGLSSTVADEIEIYRSLFPARPAFSPLDFAACAARKPPTLSGGEQVLLALHCFSLSDYATIGIDVALEQLDPDNRNKALAYLARDRGFGAALIDNRLHSAPGWSLTTMPPQPSAFTCDFAAAMTHLKPRRAPAIAIEHLSFRYPGGREIFRDADFTLEPGHAYRLVGANGAGKTTLMKLLAGVLAPVSGGITLDGAPYAPWHDGNRIFALATQNPDHQWCGATLAEDLARRRSALERFAIAPPPLDTLASIAGHLGVPSLDQHLYELPLVARKRLSWLWPLTGALPWMMLDEPTVGQDSATRAALAAAVNGFAALGHGLLFITHDDEFAGLITHRPLRLAHETVVS